MVDFVGHLNSIPSLSDECYRVILFLCETGSLYKSFFPADLVWYETWQRRPTLNRFAESWSRLCHMGVSEILGKMTVNQWNFGRFIQISRWIWTASRSAKKICRGWGGWCRIFHPRGLRFTGITLWGLERTGLTGLVFSLWAGCRFNKSCGCLLIFSDLFSGLWTGFPEPKMLNWVCRCSGVQHFAEEKQGHLDPFGDDFVAHMRNGKGLGRWQLAHADPVARDAVEHWMKPILRMIGMILWVLLRYHGASFAFHQQDITWFRFAEDGKGYRQCMPPQVTSSAVEKLMHDLVDEGEASHGFLSKPKELCLREVAISPICWYLRFVDIIS